MTIMRKTLALLVSAAAASSAGATAQSRPAGRGSASVPEMSAVWDNQTQGRCVPNGRNCPFKVEELPLNARAVAHWLGELERRLSVAVPLVEIETEVESRLKRLTRTVKIHGFRPGKVPLKVVAQQYGGQVRQEVLGDTLQKTFGEAVRQQNLRVAGYPKFEAKPPADGASDFEFSATFEVYPLIDTGAAKAFLGKSGA